MRNLVQSTSNDSKNLNLFEKSEKEETERKLAVFQGVVNHFELI